MNVIVELNIALSIICWVCGSHISDYDEYCFIGSACNLLLVCCFLDFPSTLTMWAVHSSWNLGLLILDNMTTHLRILYSLSYDNPHLAWRFGIPDWARSVYLNTLRILEWEVQVCLCYPIFCNLTYAITTHFQILFGLLYKLRSWKFALPENEFNWLVGQGNIM
jgi:hypothetical protein